MMMQHAAKLRSPSGRKLTTGFRWRNSQKTQLPKDESNETHCKENGQCLDAPEWITQPVPFLALAEHHFPGDHDDDQQRQADRVEMERLLSQLRALGEEIVRIAKQGITPAERQEADRHVDQKDPPP